MKELIELANLLIEKDKKISELETSLKKEKEDARRLREESIPDYMNEMGVSEIKLSNGFTVNIKDEVYCAIPASRRQEAYDWLTDHDFDSIIKTNVTSLFGKGEIENALALFERLRDEDLNVNLTQEVHPQTLKAFLKGQLQNGADIPLELFGARPVQTAKISS